MCTDWIGLPQDFDPLRWAAFCYLVVHIPSQRKYVGKKVFWSRRKVKQKGKKRRKLVVKESDWRTYKSSSDELKADIKKYGEENFEFHILSLHKTRAECNYTEVEEQFLRDVLYAKLPNGEFEYYNHCILARYYRSRK